jgi:NAD(P)-dependent dehydrogenase (short-subunit alcohol dehydrogenase family)
MAESKIALVTGGNRGIGYAVCRQLADAGMHVILTSRDPEKGEKAANELRSGQRSVSSYPLDVTDRDSIQRLYEYVSEKHGRLDVLVNNAGVYLDSGVSALEVSIQTVEDTMATNVYGPLRLCQRFILMMRRQNYGRVVNVSTDMASLDGMGGYSAAYRMSKTALSAMTCILASETQAHDIKVNAMSPGWVQTDMGGSGAPRTPDQGADTITWLATLPSAGPTGGFFRDRKLISW